MNLAFFCGTVDNSFSLEKYRNNEIFLIGDKVEVKRYIFFKRKGIVIGISKPEPARVDRFYVKKLHIKINKKSYKFCPKQTKILGRSKYLPFDSPKNRTSWKEDIKKNPLEIFETIDIRAFHAGGDDFHDGLRVIQTDLLESLALAYFRRALNRGAYVLNNELIENSSIGMASDNVKIEVLKSTVYSNALLSNELDNKKLILTANLIKNMCKGALPAYWWAHDQDLYLSAIRALIIADDLDKARDFIKSKRSFSKHLDQKKILRKLLRKANDPKTDLELKNDCRDYVTYTYYNIGSYSSFFSTCYTYIEWSAIYYKYFISSDFKINWRIIFQGLKDLKHLMTNKNYDLTAIGSTA